MSNEIILQEVNGEVTANSREVAEKFDKQHSEVLKKIQGYDRKNKDGEMEHIDGILDQFDSSVNTLQYIIPSKYKDLSGKENIEYLLTRDGFVLLAMGFTGKKALEWKLKYIDAFNKMEEAIHKSLNSKDAAILAIVNADGDIQRAMAISDFEKVVTKPLVQALEDQKDLVNFANKVSIANNTIDMGKMAKLLHEKNNIDIGRNRLFEILRNKKILMGDNTPYQAYIERNWFKVIETTKDTQYGTKVFTKVLVTGSGQLKIADIILGEFSKELVTV